MIYQIIEILFSFIDCGILTLFLVRILKYKNISRMHKMIGTGTFFLLILTTLIILNDLLMLEGVYTVLYFILAFLFCRICLQGRWWHQLLYISIFFISTFLVGLLLLTMGESVLGEDYAGILSMRNPVRILMLCISKCMLILLLYLVEHISSNHHYMLRLWQCFGALSIMIASIFIGLETEKRIVSGNLDDSIGRYAFIFLSVVDVLLMVILFQFSVNNRHKLIEEQLSIRLEYEKEKMKDHMLWSKKVRTLNHDLQNHLSALLRLLEEKQDEKAITYIKSLSEQLHTIPQYIETNNAAIDAMINLKKMRATKEKIDLKYYIVGDINCVDDAAFCTIFGNLMDNAIEAEQHETDPQIHVSMERYGDYLHLIIQNHISYPILRNGKLPKSTKKNSALHGLGTSSVLDTIEKIGGLIEFYEEQEWLSVNVLIPCKKEETSCSHPN